MSLAARATFGCAKLYSPSLRAGVAVNPKPYCNSEAAGCKALGDSKRF